ncbi:hypothetical protein PENCOP_c005G00657 [Penicillium coprophilum]|uniref:Uncharacterized protein n=1 Tax=Penicillium coprophilum TaxID=36646 RepID=A0A1V6URG8_9EURO|nr:hypothetical protein PENCOP_c005G00657 [Penicillium coprophilum]
MDWPADLRELTTISEFLFLQSWGAWRWALRIGLRAGAPSRPDVRSRQTRRVNDYLLKDQGQHEESVEERRAQLLRVIDELFVQGTGPPAYEAKLLSQDWGIDSGDMDYNNLHIWPAGKDWNSPLSMTEYYVKLLSNGL